MGMFCDRVVESFTGGGGGGGGGGGSTPAESRTPRELQRAATGLQNQPSDKPFVERATDTFLMDIGVKPKTTEYYATLESRQQQALAAAREATSNRSRDNDQPATQPEKPVETGPRPEPVVDNKPTPQTPVEEAQEELEERVEDLVVDPAERAAAERDRGTPAMDVGTAAGARAERAAVIAKTQAEQEAADALLKGRRATILTSPGGLLTPAEEEGKTTRRRSLLGG